MSLVSLSVSQYLAISSIKWKIKRLGNQEGKKKIVFSPNLSLLHLCTAHSRL